MLLFVGSTNFLPSCDKVIKSAASAVRANDCATLPGLDTGPTVVTKESVLSVADGVHHGFDVATSSTVEQPSIAPASSSHHGLVAAPASTTQAAASSSAASHVDSSSVAMSSDKPAYNCNKAQSSMHVGAFYGPRSSHRRTVVKPSRYLNVL